MRLKSTTNAAMAIGLCASLCAPSSMAAEAMGSSRIPSNPPALITLNSTPQAVSQYVAAQTPAVAANSQAELAKNLFGQMTELIKRYFPRAKIVVDQTSMHFEYKVQKQTNEETHLTEMAPAIGGVLGDLGIRPSFYTGRETVPKRVTYFQYEILTFAPYSQKYDCHVLTKLWFDCNSEPEFLNQFRDILETATDQNEDTTKKFAPSASDSAPSKEIVPGSLHDRDRTVDPWACKPDAIEKFKKRVVEQSAKIEANPNDPIAYSERSDCYLHLSNPAQALADANKAVELCGDSHNILRFALCNRGEAHIQLKQFKEAREDLDKVLALEPESAEAIYFRGMVKERTGDFDGATRDYELSRNLGFAPAGVEVDYAPYLAALQRRLKMFWLPPDGNESKDVSLVFEVKRNGTLKSCRVEKSSGVPAIDSAAMTAMSKASPLPPLPPGSKSSVSFEFNFDYDVFKNSAQGSQGAASSATSPEIDEAQQLLLMAAKANDEPGQIAAFLMMGDIFRSQGNLEESEINYNKALDMARSSNVSRTYDEAKTLGRIAQLQAMRGNNDDAESKYKEAFKLFKDAGKNQLEPEVTKMLTEYAKFLYKASRFDEANKIYNMLKR